MTIADAEFKAALLNNQASRDFIAQLPLILTFRDYARTEKVSDLPRRLSTAGAPAGDKPSVGDLTYYAPWGNLAIFYRDFDYAHGLVKLGSLESGIEKLAGMSGDFTVTIELAD
ncbi:cyclophilin-like fold protein [Streptomyces mirabilis]